MAKRRVSSRAATRGLDAIVLAGGQSKRLGTPKALLPLGDTTLIGAVLSRLKPVFRQVIVVAKQGHNLPNLGVELLTDDLPEQGPLVGLVRGLAASDAPWCLLVGCDMPFLNPHVISRMAERLEGCDILAPYLEGRMQTLHAFYSRECLPTANKLLGDGVTSLQALLRRCRVKSMGADEFLDLDPDMLSFRDVDTPEEYRAAQELAWKG